MNSFAKGVLEGGYYTSLLSWVSKTATPASTLPTVKEISIVVVLVVDVVAGN